ncbi:hypothetical protein ZWY2020_052194 [Hordeum vulgare]|nr:hypothetical protein ZWY2020_052193 [Hordeum vulgare]KAI4996852.1 hypothetical protein ZWY2020_052194 [Hordeum vulgare]
MAEDEVEKSLSIEELAVEYQHELWRIHYYEYYNLEGGTKDEDKDDDMVDFSPGDTQSTNDGMSPGQVGSLMSRNCCCRTSSSPPPTPTHGIVSVILSCLCDLNMIEKERQACELMREELVEVKKKSGEAEAACVVEYQLLLKRAQAIDARAEANDARFSRLMDLFKGILMLG